MYYVWRFKMKKFTKRDVEIVKQILDIDFWDHYLATELQWHAENTDDPKDRKALKIAAIYFGGEK